MNLVQVLRRCEVFVGLDDSCLQEVASLSSWRRNIYNVGEFIFCENDVAKDFYILEEGEVNLVVALYDETSKGLTQTPVDIITKGAVFGWSSLVAPHSLTMSAICVKPSTVVAVDGVELNQLFDRDCSLGYEVMRGLVRVIGARLRDLRRTLASTEKVPPLEQKSHLE
ncbi:MAG TPA: cyclic nucleotide-binding domain-containing protein [Dehalococcoidia bacterium]|nr:cyclic nucleotide-binding domain-containing protein [Dehalococcoidia bacterium]